MIATYPLVLNLEKATSKCIIFRLSLSEENWLLAKLFAHDPLLVLQDGLAILRNALQIVQDFTLASSSGSSVQY